MEAMLKQANRAREALGLPPVDKLEKGKRDSKDCCPLTMTVLKDSKLPQGHITTRFGGYVSQKLNEEDWMTLAKPNPELRQEIKLFDAGGMPSLELGEDDD